MKQPLFLIFATTASLMFGNVAAQPVVNLYDQSPEPVATTTRAAPTAPRVDVFDGMYVKAIIGNKFFIASGEGKVLTAPNGNFRLSGAPFTLKKIDGEISVYLKSGSFVTNLPIGNPTNLNRANPD